MFRNRRLEMWNKETAKQIRTRLVITYFLSMIYIEYKNMEPSS